MPERRRQVSRRPITKTQYYHSRIIDWIIANPGGKMQDCAKFVNRAPSTLSLIVNSDLFKAALEQRKREFQAMHDFGIIERTTRVATSALDAILTTIDKKRDNIPLDVLNEVADAALTRLGYGAAPAAPSAPVINTQNANVYIEASRQDLEEARMALRQAQETRVKAIAPPQPIDALFEELKETEPVTSDEQEAERAPSPHST